MRPTWIGTWIVLAILLLFQGVSSVQASPAISLQFWNDFSGQERSTLDRMVRKFNAQTPAIHVTTVAVDWSMYSNKLARAVVSDQSPDVFVIHPEMLQRFTQSTPTDHALCARALDDLVSGTNGLDTSDFVPAAWNATALAGHHYGIPLDIVPQGLFICLNAPHTKTDTLPRTSAEWLATLERQTQNTNHDGGLAFTWPRANVASIMMQWGGTFFSPDGTTCVLNQPANIEALVFCCHLIKQHNAVLPPARDAWKIFKQGRVPWALGSSDQIIALPKQTALLPFPTLGQRPATYATSHMLCMRAELTAERLEAAWHFVQYLSDQGIAWTVNGQLPARRSQLGDARFMKRKQAALVTEVDHLYYFPQNSAAAAFAAEFDRAIDDALLGRSTPEDALNRATENVNRVLQQAAAHHP